MPINQGTQELRLFRQRQRKVCKTKSGFYYHPWRPVVERRILRRSNAQRNAGAQYLERLRGRSWRLPTRPNSGNYDTNVMAPSTSNAATLCSRRSNTNSCPAAAVMPLSYNWTAMKSLVDNMSPNGNTNQAIGLAHGWMSLVGGGPFPTPPANGSELYLPAGHHPDDRRPQHAGPLVHQRSRQIDARAAADLRQRQCRRHHALHDPGQHRWRSDVDAPAELRGKKDKYPIRTSSSC